MHVYKTQQENYPLTICMAPSSQVFFSYCFWELL